MYVPGVPSLQEPGVVYIRWSRPPPPGRLTGIISLQRAEGRQRSFRIIQKSHSIPFSYLSPKPIFRVTTLCSVSFILSGGVRFLRFLRVVVPQGHDVKYRAQVRAGAFHEPRVWLNGIAQLDYPGPRIVCQSLLRISLNKKRGNGSRRSKHHG